MIKETKYNGYTAEPSDYECTDGDLATAVNVIPEDGAIKPVLAPGKLNYPTLYIDLDTSVNLHVLFVHKNSDWVHYIGYCQDKENNKLYYGVLDYYEEDGWENTSNDQWDCFYEYPDGYKGERVPIVFEGETHRSITAVGNMLIISTDKHIHYFLYKEEDYKIVGTIMGEFAGYKYLGTKIPKIQLQFALDGMLISKINNMGVTFSDNDTSSGTSWVVVDNFSYDRADKRWYYPYSFTAGNEYALYLSGESFNGMLWVEDDAGNTKTVVFSSHYDDHAGRHTFVADKDYTKVGVSCNRSLSLVSIEKGETTATVGKSIKNTSDNYTAIMGVMNSFVNTMATEKNKHIFPFFVRYATKLYDGSYVNISPPILLRPNTGFAPWLEYDENNDAAHADKQYAVVADVVARACYKVEDDWTELISGVCVFFSQPIYTYDQGKAFDKNETRYTYYDIDTTNESSVASACSRSYSFAKVYNDVDELTNGYRRTSLYDLIKAARFKHIDNTTKPKFVTIAAKEEADVFKALESVSSFFKVKELTLDSVNAMVSTTEFTKLHLDDGTLNALVNREALEDETIGNRIMQSADSYAYNKRLHLFNLSYMPPEPNMLEMTNGFFRSVNSSAVDAGHELTAYVELHTSQGSKIVKHTIETSEIVQDAGMFGSCRLDYMGWFFYPDNRAKKLYIVDRAGKVYSYELTTHETLNGAFWHSNLLSGEKAETSSDTEPASTDNIITSDTSIYVSEVNNPFAFKSVRVVTVDAGKIIGLASAAKAMSTGQFGQFPLYCLTDNGVWALELTSTGSYSSTQPITRDVCLTAESITQMDGSVLFASKKGIMQLSGSTSLCLSDVLASEDLFSPIKLPAMNKLLTTGGIQEENITIVPFLQFISDVRAIYDYVQKRIVFFNPAYAYAYVYSTLSASWGMMQSSFASKLNSYPDALAMNNDGYLVDLDNSDATSVPVLWVSRPFKFGEPDVFKTIDTIIQRGKFRTGHLAQVLYGSNDLYNWHAVWSSKDQYLRGFRGTPYKFYRLAVVGSLNDDETVYGFTTQYTPRLANQPR